MNETNDELALLTVEDFVNLAAQRGVTLWTDTSAGGYLYMTNGTRKYAFPPDYLLGDGLPSYFVESLCLLFGLPPLDFALGPQG